VAQDVLEKAGSRAFESLASRIVGASRTDGGVHAAGMVNV
jgi:tRNA U38,U39,U40 pseudouridine synthase TruA